MPHQYFIPSNTPALLKNAMIFFKVQVLVHILFLVVVTIHCMHLLVRAGQIMTLLTESEYLDYAEVVDSAMQASNRLQKYRGVAK